MSQSASHPTPDVNLSDDWCRAVLAIAGESRFVNVSGGRIHYLVWGAADSSRPVLLLVHGMLGHAHWWDIVAPFFAGDFKVLALDLSGMGDSAWRDHYYCRTFSEDIGAVVEHEATAPVVIFGHSFGGARTLMACAERPDLVRHAVVIDSSVRTTGEVMPKMRRPPGGRVYADHESALARFRLVPEQPVCAPALRAHVAEHSLRRVDGGWKWKFDPRAAVPQTLVDPAALARIRTPVDIVYGERSSVVSAQRAELIAGSIPTARRPVAMADAYHHLMLDQPLALVSTLRALLVGYGSRALQSA